VSWRQPKQSKADTETEVKPEAAPEAVLTEKQDAETEQAIQEPQTGPVVKEASEAAPEVSEKTEGATEKSDEPQAQDASAPKIEEKPNGATGDGGFTIIPEMMSIMGCSADELGDVLRSLGFMPQEKKLAAPKAEVSDEAAQVEHTTSEEQGEAKEQNLDNSTVDTLQSEAETSVAESDTKETEAKEEEEVILIWRPRKKQGFNRSNARSSNKRHGSGDGNQKRASHKHRGKNSQKFSGGNNGSGYKNRKSGKNASPRKEKQIDPDSPFAKLQALKDQIEDKAG
jgi:hypothetical protein